MVLPLTLLSRPGRQDWPSLSEAPLDSTRTFQQVPTGLTLLMAFGLFAAAAAQEPANQPEPQVLLPVDAQGNPSTQMPFVFVRPGLIESLREQLAGDEMVDYQNAGEITQQVYDKLVATGFLRMTWHACQKARRPGTLSEMKRKLHFSFQNSLKTKKTHFLGRKNTKMCSKISIFQTSE